MTHNRKRRQILYCGFCPHRLHRELVVYGGTRGWIINAIPQPRDGEDPTCSIPFDGIISHLPPWYTMKRLPFAKGRHHVTLNMQTATELDIPGAVLNHEAAGKLAAQHFYELGFTNYAAFGHLQLDYTFDKRLSGFTAALRSAGATPPMKVLLPAEARGDYERTLRFFGEALASLPKPICIMASNDRVAVTIIQACWQEGLSVPAQVAVCGFDNDPIACDLAPIPLSSVDTNPEQQAREAADILDCLMDGRPASSSPTLIDPLELVVRRSTGVTPCRDFTVSKALAYIHQHAWASDLSVPEVAEQSGVGERALYAAFNREMSVTPLRYLTNLRIERAKRLMKDSSLKVKEIRPMCGFSSDYQMHQAFKRTTGRSPGSFR